MFMHGFQKFKWSILLHSSHFTPWLGLIFLNFQFFTMTAIKQNRYISAFLTRYKGFFMCKNHDKFLLMEKEIQVLPCKKLYKINIKYFTSKHVTLMPWSNIKWFCALSAKTELSVQLGAIYLKLLTLLMFVFTIRYLSLSQLDTQNENR